MIVKEVLKEGMALLEKAEIENPLNESKYLLKYVLKEDDLFFVTSLNKELDEDIVKEYTKIVEKRCNHIPYSHITGEKEFMGLDFKVNNHTLIPRPETELIVEYMMYMFRDKDYKALELGVGTGCISISIAHFLPNINVLGVDISPEALEIANKNIEKHNIQDKVKFIQSDLFENVEGKFDILISNPPYIKEEEIEDLEPEVKIFEPRLALSGGSDGLDFYRIIARNAKDYLNEGGTIILEIGFDQKDEVTSLLKENGFKDIEVIKDMVGLNRMIVAKLD